jgi:hypothetical protein
MATLSEVSQVLLKLAAAIPHAPQLTEEHYRLFHRYLKDLDPSLLDLACDVLIVKAKFFPSVGTLRAAVVDLLIQAEGIPSAGDAWGEVVRSIATYGQYRGSPAWSHPMIGRALQAIGGYANVCRSTNSAADRSQFRHAYESLLKEYRDELNMPLALQERVRVLGNGGIDNDTSSTGQERKFLDHQSDFSLEPLTLAPRTSASQGDD